MSRSGRIPLSVPENTDIDIRDGTIYAKGKLGEEGVMVVEGMERPLPEW